MAVKIIAVSEIRQKLKSVLSHLETTGEPYFITQYSRPKAVLVRYEDYNELVEKAETRRSRITRRSDISGGEPIIRDTRLTVRHIVERFQAGHAVDEILAALPHINAAQVYAALSYYYDHQAEINELIEQSRAERVIESQKLEATKVADGVALVEHTA